ncbi:MAG: polyphosphate polymerase domain-containing protein [Spirochaetaceae bacterium]
MRSTSRFERKYRLSVADYFRVRNTVRAFMQPDHYTRQGGGQYLVHSLYYDTHDYRAFQERNDGDYGRIKLRIRVYTDSPCKESAVRAELKTKKGSLMEKHSSFASFRQYVHFCKHGSWDSPDDPVLVEFERLVRARNLEPTLLVQYRREGYRARDGLHSVRLTLDHNVHSTRARELFPRDHVLKPHRPRHIVLEIKTARREEPEWLRGIIRRHSLKAEPNSKYVQGIEIIRPHMVTEHGPV